MTFNATVMTFFNCTICFDVPVYQFFLLLYMYSIDRMALLDEVCKLVASR